MTLDVECRHVECHYNKGHYAECHYVKILSAIVESIIMLSFNYVYILSDSLLSVIIIPLC
jgi:coenzyme F420-reducing hydrogenase delta subunit